MEGIIIMTHGKVFIVDDEDDCLAYLSEIITGAGYETQTFSDSAEALDKMKTEIPGMVFLDIQMPRMNGFQVLKGIRDSESLAGVPIILLSAISAVTGDEYDPDIIQLRYGVRPDAFISKPIKPDNVREQLTKFLKPGHS